MLRTIGSILGGIVLAFALVFGAEMLSQALFATGTMPANPDDREAMRAYVAGQPLSAMLSLIAGWTVSVLAGSALAARLAERGPWPGWVVTAVFLLATGSNFLMVPHPAWMPPTSLALVALAGVIGSALGGRPKRRRRFG